MSNEYRLLTDEMRDAAMLLEKVSRLYGSKLPDNMAWTAKRLRYEADVLDRPNVEEVI